ncbi:MAG: YibE/F family protein [Candidatus Yonathbacteria bacterium]|nr:YibE/F family protein [Candidatus Yonathbacteria bacterium]NTW47828.1 YibE/F family protein [Candidatus Yonathbacteria bacterium]
MNILLSIYKLPYLFSASIVIVGLCTAVPLAYAETATYMRMRVDDVVHETREAISGTDTYRTVQTLSATVLDGERHGERIEIENDRIPLVEGDVFFAKVVTAGEGEMISVYDADRTRVLGMLGIVFVAMTLLFGGKQGARSLGSLFVSIAVIAFVLLPLLSLGFPPVPTATGIGVGMLFVAIFLTHGWNKGSVVAFGGTALAVVLTGIIAWFVLGVGMFTGLSSDESLSIALGTTGHIDLAGILLASVIIGALGVLDDVGITQVSVTRELCAMGGRTRREVYQSAMKVGKDHIGALINTLVLAYTASALPLLLLFTLSHEMPAIVLINGEAIAEEIVRALAGSVGLIVAVPLTTYVAVRTFFVSQR